ncbi:MAG: polysaccharide deacetylase family protein [Chloroflexi bacterium]|nr:polysaccharide deacetylase family protein [Chloroflexota bacterium]
MPARLREGRLPRRAVVITFDDGYADSLSAMRPLCERFDIPATVFVTAGYLDGQREFWWDDLEAQTLGRGVTAMRDLELEVNGERLMWPAGTSLRAIYDALHVRLRPSTAETRDQVLNDLAHWQGARRGVREDHRPLTESECHQLAASRRVDVQSHTVHHLWLAAHPAPVQAYELRESRRRLAEITGRPITALAYPYGFRDAVAPGTLALAREAGYSAACATVRGQVVRAADPLWLPRYVPGDVDGEGLLCRLNGFFDDFAAPHPPRGGAVRDTREVNAKELT